MEDLFVTTALAVMAFCYLWALVAAFRQSIGWFLGVLLISPPGYIVFVSKHWALMKINFMIMALSFAFIAFSILRLA